MPIHHALTFPLVMIIGVVGAILSMLAARHNSSAWFVPLWSRKRDSFTARGWRYRSWSIWCGYLTVAVVIADQVFS